MTSLLKKAFRPTPFGQPGPDGLPAIAPDKLPELTREEILNGWTPETLARYRQERDRAVYMRVFEKPPVKQEKALNDYSPARW